MYPSIQKKYGGIFVKNQYEELLRQISEDEKLEIFYMQRSLTNVFGTIIKYLKAFFSFIPYLFKSYNTIHLHYFYPLILLVWIYKIFHPKTKLIVTFHGSDINAQVTKNNQWFFRILAKKIDFTIPVGEEVAKNVAKKLKLSIGQILPVGINENNFYQTTPTIKKYDFIFVGSFFYVKGIDILIETIKSLPKDIKFCIVGKGEQYEIILKELINEGFSLVIKVDQSQSELRVLYNESRFLFMPSRSEGFPTVTLEAMYCGIPVITSKIPQFVEQVSQGENGFMIETDHIPTLTKELLRIKNISDLEYKKLSNNALKSFKYLSLSLVCKEILEIYRQ